MSVSLLDLKVQYAAIQEEINTAIGRVLDSQHFILGPEVEALEEEIAEYVSCKYGVGMSSGTDALLASLMAIGTKPGDEVITSAFTFFATAGAIARLGARPVFVDIDPNTYAMDHSKLERAITPKTKAVIPIHLFGQTAEMDPVNEIAEKYAIFVIEDAAQALGSTYKKRQAGSLGHLACFSFFPSKNLGGYGDGGIVTTDDAALASQLKQLRSHGTSIATGLHGAVGGNFRLDAIQAAVLRVKLPHLNDWNARRRQNAANYEELFSAKRNSHISLPTVGPDRLHIFNQYVVRSDRRDDVFTLLKKKHIGTAIYYETPLHLQPCFGGLGYTKGDFPQSESASTNTIAIPIYPELTISQQEEVVDTITSFRPE